MTEPTNIQTLSDGDLRETAAAIQTEFTRREAEDQHERDARFQRELDEVKAGKRLATDEHIKHLTPNETTALLNAGGLTHKGYGVDKRKHRR